MGIFKGFFKELFSRKVNITLSGVTVRVSEERIGRNLDYAQEVIDKQIWADMRQYMPIDSGYLIEATGTLNATMVGEVAAYDPEVPYGHYMYEGDIYVDPEFKVGGFYSENYGWWSRPGVHKIPSGRPINYKNPSAVRHWDEAAYNNHHTEWEKVAKKAFARK